MLGSHSLCNLSSICPSINSSIHQICIICLSYNCTCFNHPLIDLTTSQFICYSIHSFIHYPCFTLSLSMASSLPGVNMIRSCKLLMDPARLERAEREGEGLIPVITLVTAKRSRLWLTAQRLFTWELKLDKSVQKCLEKEKKEQQEHEAGELQERVVKEMDKYGPREQERRERVKNIMKWSFSI